MSTREGALSRSAEERFFRGLEETSRFLMGQADVQKALVKLVAALEELGIPYREKYLELWRAVHEHRDLE
jgi:hypothetical protein